MSNFGLLGVCETTDELVAPAVPADITALWFRRYPRPAQGRLTGRPTTGLLLVLISPTAPDRSQALRDWGDFVHLRHIAEAAVSGYTTMTPYDIDQEASALLAHSSLQITRKHYRLRGQTVVPASGFTLPKKQSK